MSTTSGDTTRTAVKVIMGKYEIGRLLGRGATAKVYHARHVDTGTSVAVKVISKKRISSTSTSAVSRVVREALTMHHLRHPHVVRLLEVLATRTTIYLVLEFLKGGELFSRVAAGGRLSEDLARRYFQQLISAVGFCHRSGIFHRDLKLENILLDDQGNLKVSDFGLSVAAADPDHAYHLNTVCGTPAYVAPEILSKKDGGYSGAAVDMWSCGVILFVITTGYLPFNDTNILNLYRKIYRSQYRFPRWTSPELRRLITRLLDPNPKTRITIDEVAREPWVVEGLAGQSVPFHWVEESTKVDEEVDRERNAFDIIACSAGLDLAGLFEPGPVRERFVSADPVEVLLDRAKVAGRAQGLTARGVEGGESVILLGENAKLAARINVRRLTGALVVVDVEKPDRRYSHHDWRLKLTAACPNRLCSGNQPPEAKLEAERNP